MDGGRIGIVGAGPAGLVAAIAGRRLGLEVTVFERATDFRRLGGGLFLHSNGQRVLAALGLLDGLAAAIEPCRLITLELPDGTRLSTFDYGRLAIPHNSGAVVLRHELQRHLLAAARREGAELRLDHSLAGIRLGGGAASLRFADGREHACDVVIGGDGIHSPTREAAGLAARRTAVGEAYLRGVAELPARQAAVREIWGPDERRFGLCPLPGGRTYFYCSVPLGRWDEIRRRGLAAWIESWRPYGSEVLATLRAVADWRRVHYDELYEVALERWCRVPVFLAGDAAHAMVPNLGQGANSAMVDALVLVRLLAASGGDLEAAGRTYEALRRPFVRRIQRSSARLGRVARDGAARAHFIDHARRTGAAVAAPQPGEEILAAGYNPREEPYLRQLAPPGSPQVNG